MPETDDIRSLLCKLGENAEERQHTAQPGYAGERDLTPYKVRGAWPGERYTLIGNSYNAECRLIGTQLEARRAGLISLMLERQGDRRHCLSITKALSYEGFVEVLSSNEREWLSTLPEDTLLGPAYDCRGARIRAAFSVWQCATQKAESEKKLVYSSRP